MQQFLYPMESGKSLQTRKEADFRKELNPAQYEAVCGPDGPVLVIAGAGSGKTRTLVYRLAHLLRNGVRPESILLLTFTRRAAQEMLARAGMLLDESCQGVLGGTFHAVSNYLLRRYASYLDYTASFTILDRTDAEGIINLLKSSLNLGGAGKRFPSKRVIINILSRSVNKVVSMEALLEDEYDHLLEFLDELLLIREHYRKFKQEHELMDYDDLLTNWQRLLVEVPHVRQDISDRFSYILVDEYQDTNLIQADIVRLLAASHGNVMAVGDDSQSIYSFRGADFRNIMEFPEVFPGTRVVRLEENYRSTKSILTVANSVIEHAIEKYTKTLFSSISGGEKPVVFGAWDEADQARFIREKIVSLRDEEGVPLRDMAVLFRSGYHSYKLELELANRQLRFEKRGGLKLTESAHIKDVLSFLRVIHNPADHLSWNRILLLLERVGPKTAQNILSRIKNTEDPLANLKEYPAGEKWRKGFLALVEMLQSLQDTVLAPGEQLDTVLAYYQDIFERVYHDDYPRRSRDLEQLRPLIAGYDDLRSFLDDTALDPPESFQAAEDSLDQGDRLVLSTVHSAKGLEWDTVFIINLVEGKFPSAQSVKSELLEEERRLFYVAVTRAKRRLFLVHPRQVTGPDRRTAPGVVSPFLAEIPAAEVNTTSGASFAAGNAFDPYHFSDESDRYSSSPSSAGPAGVSLGADRTVSDSASFREGVRVTHRFFGAGMIEKVVGPRKVEVFFPRHGKKTLSLDYAGLELVDS